MGKERGGVDHETIDRAEDEQKGQNQTRIQFAGDVVHQEGTVGGFVFLLAGEEHGLHGHKKIVGEEGSRGEVALHQIDVDEGQRIDGRNGPKLGAGLVLQIDVGQSQHGAEEGEHAIEQTAVVEKGKERSE